METFFFTLYHLYKYRSTRNAKETCYVFDLHVKNIAKQVKFLYSLSVSLVCFVKVGRSYCFKHWCNKPASSNLTLTKL